MLNDGIIAIQAFREQARKSFQLLANVLCTEKGILEKINYFAI